MYRPIKFDVIFKDQGVAVRKPVHAMEFDDSGATRVTYVVESIQQGDKKSVETEQVKIDWVDSFVVQATGTMDKLGMGIYHGDLLKDEDGKLHEVVFYNAGFFVLMGEGEQMTGVVLEDSVARKLEKVGDVFMTPELIEGKVEELEKAVEDSKERGEITSEEIKG